MSSPGGLGFLGLLWTACGAWLLTKARRRRASWVQVPGVITDLVPSRDPDDRVSWPIFRFTTVEGHEVEVTSSFGEGRPPQPGDGITIPCDPRKPHRAIINTSGQSGSSMGWILTALGLSLTTLSVLTALNIL